MRLFLKNAWASVAILAVLLASAPVVFAQQRASDSGQPSATDTPALIDPAGPSVSLTYSETLFDIGAALNACGYDNGLNNSSSIRAKVRKQIDQAVAQSPQGEKDRDRICTYIAQHHLAQPSLDLAQYVSLALYTTAPPALAPSVEDVDMPPDSTTVEGILPLIRAFAKDIDLHFIWVIDRPLYDAQVANLHNPLTQMIVSTDAYLKMPASTYSNRRYVVVLAPLLSPAQTNARVYGSNYIVVVSPDAKGQVPMNLVRHVYLGYEIDPLIYTQSEAIQRFNPFLHIIRNAPIAFRYKNSVAALVVGCLVRAIQARTMDTGVNLKPLTSDTPRDQLARAYHAHVVAVAQDAAIRQKAVDKSMSEGFILTQYFYKQLPAFEKSPDSLEQDIGPIVYGMDVPEEVSRVKHIQFAPQSTPNMVQSWIPQKPSGLDLAEIDVEKGDAKGAVALVHKALTAHTPDPARANYILARADLLNGDVDGAVAAFHQTIKLGNDPRLLAWSHIYLGRIADVRQNRAQAIAQYKLALADRDSRADTEQAAKAGLRKPYTLPGEPAPPVGANGSPVSSGDAQPQ